MKKLVRSFIGTAPGILVLIVAAAAAPIAGQFSGVMIPAATGEEVDAVQLDQWTFGSNWPTGGSSVVPLTAGRQYRIEITGAFKPFGPAVDADHDAECGWTSTTPPARSDAADEAGTTPDVYVGGAEVDWAPTTESPVGSGCNDLNRTYTVLYTPTASGSVNLVVHETEAFGYNDNVGEFTARLFTATASDPANPVGEIDELVGDVTEAVTGAAGEAEATVRGALADNGVDPDDPEGTVERKKAEAEAVVGDPQQEAERKRQELEDQIPDVDPDQTIEDIEAIIEENDPGEPGDPGDVDTGPVTEAVGAVLDEVERRTPSGDPEPPPEVADALDDLGAGSGGETSSTTTTTPSTTPTTTPSTSPTTTPPSGGGSNGGGANGGGASSGGGTSGATGETGSAPTANPESAPPVPETSGFQVSEIAAPTAGASAGEGATEAAAAPSVKGKRVTASGTTTAAPAPTPDGLATTEFALPEIGDVDLSADDGLTRPRPLAPPVPKRSNQMLMMAITIGVLFGTFEMGRRAYQRIRAERAYDTYGY